MNTVTTSRLSLPAAESAFSSQSLAAFVQQALRKHADPAKAHEMAAYMKTSMPFYGVQQPQREAVFRLVRARFKPATMAAYQDGVLTLWRLPHREEKYAAIAFATQGKKFITSDSLVLYERLIREGAWWDLVDPIATSLVGNVLLGCRDSTHTVMDTWCGDADVWIRRASLLAHLKHKKQTDQAQLFAQCLRLASDREFFIRKAIGWVLREYSKTAPDAVRAFMTTHRHLFSPLTVREGMKHLIRYGLAAA